MGLGIGGGRRCSNQLTVIYEEVVERYATLFCTEVMWSSS